MDSIDSYKFATAIFFIGFGKKIDIRDRFNEVER